uniref:Uncharacterized protein n=1 Tax=Anguilla anguilla TaxID=7936 RepID=A0A0E9TYZ0_ANGAN
MTMTRTTLKETQKLGRRTGLVAAMGKARTR